MSENEKTEEELKLEEEFTALVEKVTEKIDEQLAIAEKALAKAEKISEKYGIPFHAHISPLSQDYTPVSFQKKFGELDKQFVTDVLGIWPGGEYDCEGWEHSAVC